MFTLYCYTVISWSIQDGDTEYCDRLLSNLIFSCFLNMMRQAPAEPYDTLVNTSSCLTLFFFDTGKLVFTLYCYTVISWSIQDGDTEYCDRLLSNLIFSCFLNMMRQASAKTCEYFLMSNTFFFDTGRLVFTLYCYTVIFWSIQDGDTEYCDRLLSNLVFSCFLNMMRQASAKTYDTLVNTSSCLTHFFLAGRLVFTLYCIYLCAAGQSFSNTFLVE